MRVQYYKGADLPELPITWRNYRRAVIDFSGGLWTFRLRLASRIAPNTILLDKTTGITGLAGAPNILVEWSATDDLNTLAAPETYSAELAATRTVDNRQRVLPFELTLLRRLGL